MEKCAPKAIKLIAIRVSPDIFRQVANSCNERLNREFSRELSLCSATRFFFIRNLPQGLVLKVPYL